MCGIVGQWNFDGRPVEMDLLVEARDTMEKRGPDDSGVWTGAGTGFGHRRLSIIDLSSSGHQPMVSRDGSTVIVFNGEIYNYMELRKALENEGVAFVSKSDTEVLLEGYIRWGADKLFRNCRGMWALAIRDIRNGKIVLSRDRFGKKPLFFKKDAGRLTFGSTLNAVRKMAGGFEDVDEESIDSFINFGYVPTDRCVFKGFSKCQPSSYMEFRDDGSSAENSYWKIGYDEEKGLSKEQWIEEVEHLLKDAVRDRLVSDVPVSSFLSGGVDSTLIVALMCELGYNPKTFTMAVPGSWRDESKRARLVAEKYGTEHTEIPLDPACVNALPRLVEEFGEPYADSSAIPSYFVASMAARSTKVILTGDGGDEIFGGYGRMDFIRAYQNRFESYPSMLKSVIGPLGGLLEENKFFFRTEGTGRKLKTVSRGLGNYFDFWKRLPDWRRRSLYGPRLKNVVSSVDPRAYFLREMERAGGADRSWMSRLLRIDIRTNLVGDFLTKIDTACMAASLEGRCPMLDHRLLEKVWKMPFDLWQHEGKPKGFLKLIAKSRLPAELLTAPKHGFTIPVEDFWNKGWFGLAEDILLKGTLVKEGWIVEKPLKVLYEDVKIRKIGRDSQALYHLLCLELWNRICMKGEPASGFVLRNYS